MGTAESLPGWRPPKVWLALVFLGGFGYLAAEWWQLDPGLGTAVTRLSPAILQADLPLVAAASSALILGGLVATLTRVTRAAGASRAAGVGRFLGWVGTLAFVLFGIVLPLSLRETPSSVPASLAGEGTLGSFAGAFIAVLGLGLSVAGLVRELGLLAVEAPSSPRSLREPSHELEGANALLGELQDEL